MRTVAEVIAVHQDEILRVWTQTAQQAASAQDLSSLELAGMMPAYLSLLGRGTDPAAGLSAEQSQLIEHHLSNRLREGFHLYEILTEFAVLGRCVTRFLRSKSEVARLVAELYLTSTMVTKIFNEHLLEDEQTMKRYTRLLQNVASEAMGSDGQAPLRERLEAVLALTMAATASQTAALLLLDPASNRFVVHASAGSELEALEQFAAALDVATLARRVAAVVTELQVTDKLLASGIASLLGIRLTSGQELRGLLCVGISEQRSFSASEVRRLEGLSQALNIHLDNAQLNDALRGKIAELHASDELRDRVVSLLVNDLSAPLAAAKAGALRLAQPTAGRDDGALVADMIGDLARIETTVSLLLVTLAPTGPPVRA